MFRENTSACDIDAQYDGKVLDSHGVAGEANKTAGSAGTALIIFQYNERNEWLGSGSCSL